MKKIFSMLLFAVLGMLGLPVAAQVSTTIHLTEGSAAVLMTYDYSSGYVLYQTLKEGDNKVEYTKNGYLYLFPAPGVEEISVEPEDDYVKRSNGLQQYSIRFSLFMKQTYTVNTKGGSSGKPTATVYLEKGSKARVMELNERTFEYTLHAELHEGDNIVEFELESKFIPGTVPFYRICGEEGYILDNVTADGKSAGIMDDSYLGNYVELNVYNLANKYTVTTKERPAPEGDPTIILADGSRAYYTMFGGGNKITLNPGDNYTQVAYTASILVYAADGHRFKSFTDGNGSELPVTYGFVKIDGYSFNPPYNIVTEPDDEKEMTFTIDVDVPDKIECLFIPSGKAVNLREGETVVTFKKSREPEIQITNQGLSFPEFYLVTVNGVELKPSYYHSIVLEDGMKIVARRKFPETNITYNMEYLGVSGNFWTSILGDDKEVSVVDGKIVVPAGTSMELYNINALDWKIKEVVLPDGRIVNKINPSQPLKFTARNDGTIKVDAEEAQEIEIVINIASDASDVRVFNGDLNFNNELTGLKNGTNRKTIKDNNYNYIIVRHIDQFSAVKSVSYRETAGSEVKPAEYNNQFRYYIVPDLKHRSEIFINGGEPAGVESITVGGDGKVEYFDLTGRKVDAENLLPGLYIRVSDGRSEKVVIK